MSPVRRPGQPPVVTVDVSPAYELLQTIAIMRDEDRNGTYDLGEPSVDLTHAIRRSAEVEDEAITHRLSADG